MTMREEWLALAKRCEAATGPDRKLDAAILEAIGYTFEAVADGHWAWLDRDGSIVASVIPLTRSLDAITGLIERELPTFRYGSGRDSAGGYWAGMSKGSRAHRLFFAATEALARSAAFCRAKAAEAGR